MCYSGCGGFHGLSGLEGAEHAAHGLLTEQTALSTENPTDDRIQCELCTFLCIPASAIFFHRIGSMEQQCLIKWLIVQSIFCFCCRDNVSLPET